MTHSLFISYRRADAAGHAQLLYDRLRHWFKADELFYDQSSVDIGETFPDAIRGGIDAAKVVLLVIGPDWLETLNSRVSQPGIDFVRAEVAYALMRSAETPSMQVIPILMGGVQMPSAEQLALPLRSELHTMCTLNAHTFKGTQVDWDGQFTQLLKHIKSVAGVPRPCFHLPAGVEQLRHIPHPRNRNFTGRDKELDVLHRMMNSGQHAELTAVTGLGGMGKTQLALEYSYRHITEYAGVWWFRSDTPANIGNDILMFGCELGMLKKGQDDKDAKEVLKDIDEYFGHQDAPWLLVYDNATEPSTVKPYLFTQGAHHTIITSCYAGDWTGIAATLEIAEFNRSEAVQFLLTRTCTNNAESATFLVEELGNLPLALEQAGAYINNAGIDINDYLSMFKTKRSALLKRRSETADYPKSVATTWSLAFDKIEETSPVGTALLQLLSFFSPDVIPKHVILDGEALLPQPIVDAVIDGLALNDAVAKLRSYSLVQIVGDGWSIHRLVQSVTRDRLGDKASEWSALAVDLLRNSIERQGPNQATRAYEAYLGNKSRPALLSHAITAGRLAETYNCGLKSLIFLYLQIADYYQFGLQENEFAQYFAKRALELGERVYGPEHPEVATVSYTISMILYAQQKFTKALEYAQRALKIDEKFYRLKHISVARDHHIISQIFGSQRSRDEELIHMQRVLDIEKTVLGAEHAKVAITTMSIAKILLKPPYDYNKALEYMQRSLEINSLLYGKESDAVAEDMFNIGNTYSLQGNHDKAFEYMKCALKIDEKVFGRGHLQVAMRNVSISQYLIIHGDLDRALKYAQRAREIQEKLIAQESHYSFLNSMTSGLFEIINSSRKV